jgi:3-deoxy-manno-octulosonate cytidylyltransferase (CMP-KDO synthetase)
MKIVGLIPCRLKSSRLEKKALLPVDGLPLIVHTFKRAMLAKNLHKVFVCTDSYEIKNIVETHGGFVIMTKKSHKTGTDRIAEAALKLRGYDLIIDIQGDFPMLDPSNINKLIEFHKKNEFDIVVPSSPLETADSKDIVKVLMTEAGKVLYFTRSQCPSPFSKKPNFFLKHMSIISFTPKALKLFSKKNPSKYEKIEGIELLRALENDLSVGSFVIKKDIFSVDVKKDYLKAVSLMPIDPIRKKY